MALRIGKEIGEIGNATYVANGVGFIPMSAMEFIALSGYHFMPVPQVSHPIISALNKRVGALQYEYRDCAQGIYSSLHYWRIPRTQPRVNVYVGAAALNPRSVERFFRDISDRTGLSVMQTGVTPYEIEYMSIMSRILRDGFVRQ